MARKIDWSVKYDGTASQPKALHVLKVDGVHVATVSRNAWGEFMINGNGAHATIDAAKAAALDGV